jgi:eukaryotic-like serine/threonine-protein kinase
VGAANRAKVCWLALFVLVALTPYSTLHVSIATVAGVLAVVHLVMWVALRHERAHGWVAASLFGFCVFDLGLAGSSMGAQGQLGPAAPWLLVTVPTALLLPLALLHTVWSVLDLPVVGPRRALAWVMLALVLPGAVHLVWLVVSADPSATSWEATRYEHGWPALPYLVALSVLGLAWFLEGLRCRKTQGFVAWAALAAAVPAMAIMVREILLVGGVLDGPTGIGLAGLPLALFASATMVVRYVSAVREASTTEEADARYQRLHRLGRGGMGEVWLGMRRGEGGFRRVIVLKRIRADVAGEDLMARFWAEARVAARLHHPNVVAVHDFGRVEGGWFIVMEYLAGASLYDLLCRAYDEQRALPPGLIVAVGEKMCRGLECAHTHGVLHRDISPDNVIVTFDGEVKVLDFGIAKEADRRDEVERGSAGDRRALSHETAAGGIAGKRRYLAPERLVGEAAVVESDIFSVAVVMLELFGVDVPAEAASLAGSPAPMSDAGLAAPGGIEAVLRRALSPHPRQRPRSAGAFADELAAVATELAPLDLGGFVRRMFPERYAAARKLETLVDPTPDEVAALLVPVSPPTERSDASGEGASTRPGTPAPPVVRTVRT